MNKDEIINESGKDSNDDNPQDACERKESFQILPVSLFNPIPTISRIPIIQNQTFECFDALVKNQFESQAKGDQGACSKFAKNTHKKKHSKANKNKKRVILCKRFSIEKLIDSGTHGQVFEGIDLLTKDEIAIKIIPESNFSSKKFNREVQIVKDLNIASNNYGFPLFIHKAKLKKYNFYVMIKLGNNLKFMKSILNRFTLENVLMISMQIISRLKILHSLGYVHRDIKPANILFGTNELIDVLHVIDFGLTKKVSKFKDEDVPPFIFERQNVSLSGTPNYASVNLHCGWEECFKSDDMEGFVYMMIYLLKGVLPWESMRTDDNYYSIMRCKQSIDTEDLCSDLPQPIKDLTENIRTMTVYDEPDYKYVEDKLIEAGKCEGIELSRDEESYKFIWDFKPN